ncbi:glycosyltransferase [bacterium]|nr:glycosyltransferase [bacterium]
MQAEFNTATLQEGLQTAETRAGDHVRPAPVRLSEHPVVYFAPGDWWTSNPADWARLAMEFSKHTPVLFINSVATSIPRKVFSRNFFRRVARKLPSFLRVLRKPMPNLYVFTPLTLFTGRPWLLRLNTWWLQTQIKILRRLLGLRSPILWVSNAAAASIVEGLDYACLVYSVTDKFDASRYIKARETLTRFDEMLTRRADHVMCVSRPLFRYYQGRTRKGRVHYLPHAVDFEHFNPARIAALPTPADIARVPHPIIGYHGSLTDSNDLELLAYCAERRPDWSFFLIGKAMHNDVLALAEKFRNVILAGFKKYEEIPAYARHFDVCLLFWKLTEWISYCSPYKTKEYLAMGKPTVSVPIPEIVEEYSDVISIAATPQEFLDAIERELRNNSPEKERARVARVQGETWAHYVERVVEMFLGNDEVVRK